MILPVLADPGIPDEQVGGLLRERIGMGVLREASTAGWVGLPRAPGRRRCRVRHYWELCVLLALRDGLRSGDVHVPGSRRYADPGAYLFTPDRWAARQGEFCALVGKPADPKAALAQGKEELHAALEDLEVVLAAAAPEDTGRVRLDCDGKLVIPPLTAENVPAEAKAIRDELSGMLPFAPIASLLIELDHRTGFLGCFTHAGGHKQTQSVELKRNILAVLIADATNLGLTKMAEACGVPYDVLAWTQEWYVREETLREANTVIVNHHHGLELAGVFGGGTMSSSDGQRFPTRGKSLTARAMNIHFADQGLSTYTHVSDQHSTFGTKVIVPTMREAHYVLDDFLGNATDLPIREHATDTHGVTLVNFALFDLVGKALTPRIRDLGKITLCRDEPPAAAAARYPNVGQLLGTRLNEDLIAGCSLYAAALLAVLDHTDPTTPADGAARTGRDAGDPLRGVLDHEERFVAAALAGAGLALTETQRSDATTTAFLVPAPDLATGAAVLRRVPSLRGLDPGAHTRLATQLGRIYPDPAGGLWHPPGPDLLADTHLLATLDHAAADADADAAAFVLAVTEDLDDERPPPS